MKKRPTEFIVDCGCYQTVSEPDGDCAGCPKCGEIAIVIEVCAGECGDHDGKSCDCDEREEQDAEHKRMFSLWQGERTAGLHLTDEEHRQRELDGVA